LSARATFALNASVSAGASGKAASDIKSLELLGSRERKAEVVQKGNNLGTGYVWF